jgi:hypothetical protein
MIQAGCVRRATQESSVILPDHDRLALDAGHEPGGTPEKPFSNKFRPAGKRMKHRRFPTVKHFTSWLGLSPKHQGSADKILRAC